MTEKELKKAMDINLTTEEVLALVRVLRKGENDVAVGGFITGSGVYIHPAAQLRQRADEIEQEERDRPVLQAVLRKLTTH